MAKMFVNKVNSRKLILNINTCEVEENKTIIKHEFYDEEFINSLVINKDLIISLNNQIDIKGAGAFTPLKIVKEREAMGVSSYGLHTSILNCTSLFLLPSLKLTPAEVSWNNNFMNAYLSMCTPEFMYIYVRGTYPSLTPFYEIDEYYKIYRLKYEANNIKTFFNGKFSKLTPELKVDICEFHRRLDTFNLINEVINRSPKRKKQLEDSYKVKLESDAELYSKPLIEREYIEYVFKDTPFLEKVISSKTEIIK